MRRWTDSQPSLAWRETEGALAMAGESSQDEGKNRRAKRQTSPMREKRQKTSRSMSNRRATRQASPMVEERPKRSRSRSNSRATRQTSPMGKFFSEKRQPSGRKEEEEERAEPDKERTRQADASIAIRPTRPSSSAPTRATRPP